MSLIPGAPLSGALSAIVKAFRGTKVSDPVPLPTPVEVKPEPVPVIGKEVALVLNHYAVYPDQWKTGMDRGGWWVRSLDDQICFYGYGMSEVRMRESPKSDRFVALNKAEAEAIHIIRRDLQNRKRSKELADSEASKKRAFESLHSDLHVKAPAVKKPILLIDMDGVVADYYRGFAEGFARNHPEREVLLASELTEFYIENMYDKAFEKDIFAITRNTGFFTELKPIPGAVAALQKILAEGKFDPYLCTAPDNDYEDLSCHSEKAEWVRRILGEDWLDRLILTKDKTLVQGAYIIDDKPEMKGVNIDNPPWKRIVFDQAYNKETPGERLHDWREWPALEAKLLAQL